jgi:hypothetical protein
MYILSLKIGVHLFWTGAERHAGVKDTHCKKQKRKNDDESFLSLSHF